MIQLVSLWFLAVIIVNIACATRIGYIYNATYVPADITSGLPHNGTCLECICYAFFSRIPAQYIGLNCYSNNNTCLLFVNYSSSYMVQANTNSTFSFIELPPLQVSEPAKATTDQSIEVNTRQSTLMSTVSTCASTVIPIGRVAPLMAWDFEGNLNDRLGIYNGTASKNITYGLGRNGCGKCLNLTSSLNQSVYVNRTPYIDLRNISFSVETWVKPTIVTDGIEHVILAQCGSLGVRQCMRVSVGSPGPMSFRLRSDTMTGSQNVSINVWSHLAYVYNMTARFVSLYINGTLDQSGSGHGPFSGVPAFIQIGNVDSIGGIYYSGCIDEIFFYNVTRTASEIAATYALG